VPKGALMHRSVQHRLSFRGASERANVSKGQSHRKGKQINASCVQSNAQAFLVARGDLNAFSAAFLLEASPSLTMLLSMNLEQQQALQRRIAHQVTASTVG
jgi:hypothetical protein